MVRFGFGVEIGPWGNPGSNQFEQTGCCVCKVRAGIVWPLQSTEGSYESWLSRRKRFGCWFEPGQVVRLKSGGPLMTVEAILHDDKNAPIVVCTWFNGGIAEEADFYETSLKLVGGDS